MKYLFALALLMVVVDRAMFDCCTPSQWEGQQALFGTSVRGVFGIRATLYESVLSISYDADNDLKAISGNITSKNLGSRIRIVYNYDEGVRYAIYPDVEACRVSNLTSEFRKSCIPRDATLIEDTYMGMKSASILPLKIYRVVRRSSSVQSSVTENCVPVDEVMVVDGINLVETDTYKFYDLTSGIADRNVFSVPDYCDEGILDDRLEGIDAKFFSENRLFGI